MSGFLFENMILNHRLEIIEKLQIPKELVVSASPYFQVKKTRNKGVSVRPVLIYQGQLQDEELIKEYFDKVLSIGEILEL
mgnify:FL=1